MIPSLESISLSRRCLRGLAASAVLFAIGAECGAAQPQHRPEQRERRFVQTDPRLANALDATDLVTISNRKPGSSDPSSRAVLYSEDFESGTLGSMTPYGGGGGFWHVRPGSDCGTGGSSQVASFSIPGGCSFETGSSVFGGILTPWMEFPADSVTTLSFDRFNEGEFFANFDRFEVYVEDEFSTLIRVGEFLEPQAWTNTSIDLSSFPPGEYRILFYFDSGDELFNNFRGAWFDNVVVDSEESDGCPPAAIFATTTGSPTTESLLYSIDLGAQTATLVGPTGFLRVGAIDYGPDDLLYGIGERPDFSGVDVLIRINPLTGAGTEIGPLGVFTDAGFGDMSFRDDGTLFAYNVSNLGPGHALYTVDTTTGAATFLGASGYSFSAGNALSFGANGTLYLSNTTGGVFLNSLDQSTGAGTSLSPIANISSRLNAMDLDQDSGLLLAVDRIASGGPVRIGWLNTATSSFAEVFTSVLPLDGIAFAVPDCDVDPPCDTPERGEFRTPSIGAEDGYVREPNLITMSEGPVVVKGTTAQVGDDSANWQNRGVFSFDTAGLPDDAQITTMTLRLTRASSAGNVATLGDLILDMGDSLVGANASLDTFDYDDASAAWLDVATSFPVPAGNGFTTFAAIDPAYFSSVDLEGKTQFRVRFESLTDNDNQSDYLSFHTGEASAWLRPELIVEYATGNCVEFPEYDPCDGPFVATIWSSAAQDGGVGESHYTSEVGSTFNAGAGTAAVGDTGSRTQQKLYLHFDTSAIPTDATITSAAVRLYRSSATGTAAASLGSLVIDMRNPYAGPANFGSSDALEAADFESYAQFQGVATFTVPTTNTYTETFLDATGMQAINKGGATQMRVRFTLPDDGDFLADQVSFGTGNFGATSPGRPRLIVTYMTPCP